MIVSAWVISTRSSGTGKRVWWDGFGWTLQPVNAHRFATESGARRVADQKRREIKAHVAVEKAAKKNPARRRRAVTSRARGGVTPKVVRDCGGVVGLKKKAKGCRKVKNKGGRIGLQRMKQNPATDRELQEAVQRFTGFRGDVPQRVDKVTLPKAPRVLLHVGEVLGIMYRTERDGVVEDYLHQFRKKSRPTLAANSDGKTLYLLGGAYRVTDHGIEDA